MKREGLEYAMMLAIVCLAIVGAVVVMTSLASADDSQVKLPDPEYISADTMVLSRAEAPERANSGLATYESFEQALEALNKAQRIQIFGFNMAVLTPVEQMQIVLAFNHAIGIQI